MLVLTRKTGEEIIIDGNIRLTFTIKGDKVKVGIDAPAHIRVDRQEIAQRVLDFTCVERSVTVERAVAS